MGPFIITLEQKNTDFESFQKHYVTYILTANKSDLTLCMLGILLMIFCCLLIFPIFSPNILSEITLVYQTVWLHTRTDILFC